MLPKTLNEIRWTKESVELVKRKLDKEITSQVDNILSTQQLREEDHRKPETIYNNVLISLLTELSVCSWLNGKKNLLDFNPNDPYSYAWDVFALGRRIEVKKFTSRNFNIDPNRRGGGCVDMHSFENFDVAELLFACKVDINDVIVVKPIFIMTRESYFSCKVRSEQNPGTFYLQYDKESRDNPHTCKVYE